MITAIRNILSSAIAVTLAVWIAILGFIYGIVTGTWINFLFRAMYAKGA